MYCRLLENAVRRLQNLPPREDRHVSIDLPLTAYLPNDYVPPGRHKVDVYRRLTQVVDDEQLQGVREELRDRFGPLPEEVERLLELRQLALQAAAWGVEAIRLEPRREGQGPFVVLDYGDAERIRLLASRSPRTLRIVDQQQACLVLEPDETDGELLLGLVKSVLQPA